MELKDLREQIDAIDVELTKLFIKRMGIAKQVAEYKKANNLPVCAQLREEQILQNLVRIAGDEYSDYVSALYSTIFTLSRSCQEQQISAEN